MRLIWLVLLFTGIGFFAYIAALIIIPEASDEEPFSGEPGHSHPGDAGTAKQLLGILLIALGVIFLVRNMIPSYIFHTGAAVFAYPVDCVWCGADLERYKKGMIYVPLPFVFGVLLVFFGICLLLSNLGVLDPLSGRTCTGLGQPFDSAGD